MNLMRIYDNTMLGFPLFLVGLDTKRSWGKIKIFVCCLFLFFLHEKSIECIHDMQHGRVTAEFQIFEFPKVEAHTYVFLLPKVHWSI